MLPGKRGRIGRENRTDVNGRTEKRRDQAVAPENRTFRVAQNEPVMPTV